MSNNTVMLRGENVSPRPVLERDIDRMYEIHMDIANRGEFWPLDVESEVAFKKEFQETGFFKADNALLVMVDADDKLIGDIGFFRPADYMTTTFEIFYRVYDESNWGKGVTSEALGLLVRWLFDSKQCERLQLLIDVENVASRRVAEKSGFTTEGTLRSIMYHRGVHRDMVVYSVLRGEAARL